MARVGIQSRRTGAAAVDARPRERAGVTRLLRGGLIDAANRLNAQWLR
jgi:hypothetical protein